MITSYYLPSPDMAYSVGFGDWDCVETHTMSDIRTAMEIEWQQKLEKSREFYRPQHVFKYYLYNLCISGICEFCHQRSVPLYRVDTVDLTIDSNGTKRREVISQAFGHKSCIYKKED